MNFSGTFKSDLKAEMIELSVDDMKRDEEIFKRCNQGEGLMEWRNVQDALYDFLISGVNIEKGQKIGIRKTAYILLSRYCKIAIMVAGD